MSNRSNFEDVFEKLKSILDNYANELNCVNDESGHFHLDTKHIMKNKKPLFFGSVQIKKTYVSYYLMPVYVFPDLLETLSPELKRRMQGKSCFNFKSVDPALFEELAQLTGVGYQKYKGAGYINYRLDTANSRHFGRNRSSSDAHIKHDLQGLYRQRNGH